MSEEYSPAVVAGELHAAAVEHDRNVRDGERRLRHVCGEHDLSHARRRGRKDALLLGGGQLRVQGQEQPAGGGGCEGELAREGADLGDAGQEEEHRVALRTGGVEVRQQRRDEAGGAHPVRRKAKQAAARALRVALARARELRLRGVAAQQRLAAHGPPRRLERILHDVVGDGEGAARHGEHGTA